MTRAINVKLCHSCPKMHNSQGADDVLKPYCFEAKRIVPHEVKDFSGHKVGWVAAIPDWCPLPVAEAADMEKALRRVTVGLIAAVSLLKAGGKGAVATDLMFDQMIADYERRIADGRAALGGE